MYTVIRCYQHIFAYVMRVTVLLGLLLTSLAPSVSGHGAPPVAGDRSTPKPGGLVKGALANPAQATHRELDPAALEQSDWYAQATAYIEASEYHFTPIEPGSYAAPNRAQNLRATFGPQGLQLTPRTADMNASTWQVSLTLAGFGLPGDIQPIGEPTHTSSIENRIETTYPGGISEWYLNDQAGLEQGFTIRELPQGAAVERAALTLEFMLVTALTPRLVENQALEFYAPQSAIPIRYEGLHAFDANGSSLPAWLDLEAAPEAEGGSYILHITVETASASLPITVDPVFTWPSAIGPADQMDAYFGMVVNTVGDLNGDGYDDIAISAPGYTHGNIDEGRVYVYHGSANGPVSALDQNYDWQADGYGQPGAWFGASVASAGDVDGDGYDDVLVGAPFFDTGTVIEGRVFLYRGGVTGIFPLPSQELDPTDQETAEFGWAVAAAGDTNNDGFADFLIGAPGFSDASIVEGAVYLYLGGSSGPTLASGWPAHPTDQMDARFGEAVAWAGDVDRDTFDDFLVGAPGYGPNHTWEGAAYLFLGGLGTPDAFPDWQADPTNQDYAAFGTSLAAAGNADQDLASRITLLSQGFEEGSMPPTAWERRSLGTSSNTWMLVDTVYNPDKVHSGSFASWVSYDAINSQDEWLLSPAFFIPIDVVTTTLEFWMASDTLYPGATATLFAIEASGSYTDTLWDMIADENWPTFDYRLVSIDLSVYAGQSIRLAWQYHGLDGESLAMDEIHVYAQTQPPEVGYPDVIIGAPGYSGENSGEGRVYVYSGSNSGLEAKPYWWVDPTNQDDAQFGAVVSAIDPATYLGVVVGAPKYDDNIYWDEGRLYVFPSLGGLNQTQFCILDPYQHANNQMGQWVSPAGDTDGDGAGEILVGAYNAIPSIDVGQEGFLLALEVTIYGNGPWCELTGNTLLHPSDQYDSGFGLSASAGDFNGDGYVDVVGGAYSFDASVSDEGRVFAYYGTPHGLLPPAGETWYVDPSDQDYAYFGGAAEGAGDVNGDGYDDLIVSAPGLDIASHTDQGMVVVYYGSPGGLTWKPVWGDSPIDQDMLEFGRSASTAGDVNGDGFADIIIGAPGYSDAAATEGKALVYFGSAQGLSDTPAWQLDPTDQAGAQFGWSVSNAGDMDHDGYDDIIVGAPYMDLAGQMSQGAAYIYRGAAAGPATSQWVILVASPHQAHANFGFAVAAAGDVNGDAYGDVIISAPYYNGSHLEMGRVFAFHGGSSAPTIPAWAVSPEPQHYAHVGFSINSAGDVNGDGYDDVIVGSSDAYGYRDESGDVYEGRAYVYMGAPGGLSVTPAWQADPTNQNLAAFGMAVASAGDLNGDGYADILIGAPY
ncbi:MAG: FG-GAP repeat protein, partial [Anaerolineales bacterium]|nr:FG-GAP repeat protein [Anaerolineales bacterium]